MENETGGPTIEIYEIFKPLIRKGIIFNKFPIEENYISENLVVRSRIGGIPYHNSKELWPVNAGGIPLKFDFQINTIEFPELSLPQGLYVSYSDSVGFAHEIKYYPQPIVQNTNLEREMQKLPCELITAKMQVQFLPPESLISLLGKSELEKIAMTHSDTPWQTLYGKLMSDCGFRNNLFEDHIGGWHQTYEERKYMPPKCTKCSNDLLLIIQFEYGDWTKSLWCCNLHPSVTRYAVHK